jgi:hypothetical protein
MKTKITIFYVTLFLIFYHMGSYAQCKDSSTVTLSETSEWLKLIISEYGELELPPIKYSVEIVDSCSLKFYEMGYDFSTGKVNDTNAVYEVNYKDFDIANTSFSPMNKKNTRYFVKLSFNKIKIKTFSEESGEILLDAALNILNYNKENQKYVGIFINQKDEKNLPERIIKAFNHAKCLCGESEKEISNKIKSKF